MRRYSRRHAIFVGAKKFGCGCLRDEFPNETVFKTISEAQEVIER
jgi:hypothetical protein